LWVSWEEVVRKVEVRTPHEGHFWEAEAIWNPYIKRNIPWRFPRIRTKPKRSSQQTVHCVRGCEPCRSSRWST